MFGYVCTILSKTTRLETQANISTSRTRPQALHLGLRDYILFAPRNSLIGSNKEGIMEESEMPRKSRYFNFNLSFFSGSPSSSVGTIILPPSPFFFRCRRKMLVNKDRRRRNSDPAAGIVHFKLDIGAAPRQTGKRLQNFVHFLLYGTSLFFQGRWDMGTEGGVSRRMVRLCLTI